MLAECVAEPVRPGPVPYQGHVDAPQQEWQPLAEMAEDDLEPGILIEDAAQHQPDALCRGLDSEPPGGAQDVRVLLDIILVVDVDDCRMRHGGVHIKRPASRLWPVRERPKPPVIHKKAASQPWYRSVL